ncbi:MAG: hypothetical protein U1F65_06265 [Verrucomicrobiota bacterium]
MDADENDIITYLKTWSGQYVSAREIARKAASKKRFQNEPDWAVPVLSRLVEKGIVEADSMAHYRLVPERKSKKHRRWISPEIQKILEKTGKDFSEGVEIDQPETPEGSGEKPKAS